MKEIQFDMLTVKIVLKAICQTFSVINCTKVFVPQKVDGFIFLCLNFVAKVYFDSVTIYGRMLYI